MGVDGMRWVTALSTADCLSDAIAEVAEAAARDLGRFDPDLVLLFVSDRYDDEVDTAAELLRQRLQPRELIGCSAGGLIGADREIEGEHAVSLIAAQLPDVTVTAFHVYPGDGDLDRLLEQLPVPLGQNTIWLLLPDPIAFPTPQFISGLEQHYPGSAVFGGLASGHHLGTALFAGESVYTSGAVGVALSGDIAVQSVVAQGCRPVGNPMFVTSCRHNVIDSLDGRTPLAVVHELYQRADQEDQTLFESSLFLGLVMRDDQQTYRQGDFLIRALIGLDPEQGSMAVGGTVRARQVVQFHLRERHAASADIEQCLTQARESRVSAPAAALLFSCLGRGQGLYGYPNHDSQMVQRLMGPLPLGGFFCNGEIGPVGGHAYLHGYTSVVVFLGPKAPK